MAPALDYRLNVMGQKASSHVDYGKNDRYSAAPVFTYALDGKTEFTFEYNFDRAVVESTLPLTVSKDAKPLRRSFMADKLGVAVKDSILPLSSTPLYLPPFWLKSGHVLVRD